MKTVLGMTREQFTKRVFSYALDKCLTPNYLAEWVTWFNKQPSDEAGDAVSKGSCNVAAEDHAHREPTKEEMILSEELASQRKENDRLKRAIGAVTVTLSSGLLDEALGQLKKFAAN